jgi:tRNA-Thr(GGU) m(6)t(6)A37 methyltransferase TsaA
MTDSDMRAGEIAGTLPATPNEGVYFIGVIRTPWHSRAECPKRGAFDGPVCSLVIDERWRMALTGIEKHHRLQVLYWMHQARRDLVLQAPRLGTLNGTFALRSPVRPNPIASSIVEFVAVRDSIVEVRGLDCLDGTPLIDLKPERGRHETAG